MSWRDKLRPASFRGVAFDTLESSFQGGRRGQHHEYPARDRGYVEDLGLTDHRIRLEAILIGDDYMERRDELIAALEEPGAGELIHPFYDFIEVMVDPGGWTVTESTRRGRHCRIALSFIDADDEPGSPCNETDGAAATDEAAEALEEDAIEVFGLRIDLSGIEAVIDDAVAWVDAAFSRLDGIRRFASRVVSVGSRSIGLVSGTIARGQGIMRELMAVRDIGGAIFGFFDAIGGAFGRSKSSSTRVNLPGQRPVAAIPKRRRRSGAEAAEAAVVIRAALDEERAKPALSQPRLVANRAALEAMFDIALIAELGRAVAEADYDLSGSAIEAMKDLDQRIEEAIRAESDREDGGDDRLVRRLRDLRAAAREAVLSTAAALAPIATVQPGESMPTLALAWRLSGGIAIEADIISRNRIAHPLWAPDLIEYREAGNG